MKKIQNINVFMRKYEKKHWHGKHDPDGLCGAINCECSMNWARIEGIIEYLDMVLKEMQGDKYKKFNSIK